MNDDKEQWDEMAEELMEASQTLSQLKFNDNRPAIMVATGLMIMSYLVEDYKQGNIDLSYLFTMMISDFADEIKFQEKTLIKFDELLSGVDLDK
jgi:hypothetical protein